MFDQFRRMNWFEQELELVAAKARSSDEIMHAGLTGEQHDPALGKNRTHRDRGLDAVGLGHRDLAEENPRAKLPRPLNRGLTIVGSRNLESVLGEDHLKGVGDDLFVVCD